MYSFLLQAHSEWRYIVLVLLLVSIVKYLIGWLQGSTWGRWDRLLGTATTIVVDIQLLMGLILWGLAMSQGTLEGRPERAIEHPTTMIVAIVVMHLGWMRARKQNDDHLRHRWAALTFLVTGALVALGLTVVGALL